MVIAKGMSPTVWITVSLWGSMDIIMKPANKMLKQKLNNNDISFPAHVPLWFLGDGCPSKQHVFFSVWGWGREGSPTREELSWHYFICLAPRLRRFAESGSLLKCLLGANHTLPGALHCPCLAAYMAQGTLVQDPCCSFSSHWPRLPCSLAADSHECVSCLSAGLGLSASSDVAADTRSATDAW